MEQRKEAFSSLKEFVNLVYYHAERMNIPQIVESVTMKLKALKSNKSHGRRSFLSPVVNLAFKSTPKTEVIRSDKPCKFQHKKKLKILFLSQERLSCSE